MKKLLLATLAIASFALPASAAVILPNVFADEYCSLRGLGVNEDDALNAATRKALVDGTAVKVEFNGVMVDSDVLRAMQATQRLCPQFM